MSNSEQEKKDNMVEVYHRVNRLKLKAGASSLHDGPGFIDPAAIKRAQTVIQKRESLYLNEVEKELLALEKAWDKAKTVKEDKQAKTAIENVRHEANHIKDLAETFGYELMQHFGQSLREFANRVDVQKKEHHIIVQAHIDVMWVVYHENIKDQGGPKAEELKKIVAVAIEKYS